MAGKEKKAPGFEDNMRRLEEIVRRLEKGDASLEESVELFREGTLLAKSCDELLDRAEKQVTLLTAGEDGQPVETEFEAHE